MGLIDFAERVGRNAWRIPLLGRVLDADDARAFAKMPRGRFRGVYRDFAEAEAAIPHNRPVGYDHDAMAGMYRDRMGRPCESDYAVLFWLRDLLQDTTRVLDFGGHIGVSYYGWKQHLRYPAGLRWTVCDMPAIVREGEAIAKERGASALSFVSDPADSHGADILLVAGSLQYVDMRISDLIARIGARPRHLFVNKLPLYDGETFVTVQSTGRAFHPYRIENRAAFVAGVTALGYRVVDEWQNSDVFCRIPHTRGRSLDAYSGYYFTLDD